MHRFVVLYHEWPAGPHGSHCDLMFETGDVLRTWSLCELPLKWAAIADTELRVAVSNGNTVAADQLGDHRPAYLDFEGPVSGDRGSVQRLDGGHFETLQSDADACEVVLTGEVLQGAISLRRNGVNWRLTAL
jgi:hypothetical protein